MSNGVSAYGKVTDFAVKIGENKSKSMQSSTKQGMQKAHNNLVIFFNFPPNVSFVLFLILNLADFE